MRVIGEKRLVEFSDKHADAEEWIAIWRREVMSATWQSPHDIRKRFATASFLRDGKVIFNVKGNRYRLVTIVAYQTQVVVVHWVGTHAEYDKKDFV